jgi:tetratricopeptide (TPR) repeat protein
LGLCLLLCGPVQAEQYSGEWAYQALNAGDTNFQVEQEGARITFYRVLHPLYRGERFKLEHLYRGQLESDRITGHLWVREEGMADFERLRPFSGRVRDRDRIDMDDLPLRRVGRPAAPADGAKYSRVVIQPGARGPGSAEPSESAATESDAPAEQVEPERAPPDIPRLVPVARRADAGLRRRAGGLLRRGDAAYAKRDYAGALGHYQRAYALDARRIELLYKLGLCHGILGSKALRAGRRADAAGHYRRAIGHWRRAVRLDPYNAGARENIRRAQRKLAGLAAAAPD